MATLSGAYHGYLHQDAVTAYLLATLLVPGATARTLSAERRVTHDDCFDDIELRGTSRRRIQVKSHQVEHRPLHLTDFTTQEISFRIDRAVRSFTAEASPADEYRLFATYDPPDQTVSQFLEPAQDVSQLLPGVSTQRYRLRISQIWPEGGNSVWPHLAETGRDIFASFCVRFVIEIGCPHSSTDLRQPSEMEQSLLRVLADEIGVGFWPNNNRDVTDSAAHLIYEATVARATSATLAEAEVIQALGLRIDYGRVPEILPVDARKLVRRVDALGDITRMLSTTSRVAITGPPGIGKSWLLHQLAIRLADEGWWVATHYCFIDPFDTDQSLRASIETIFGSIIFELLERDPSITHSGPRFAAGPRELEKLLEDGSKAQPNRRIAIIVDGLDHADRISLVPSARLATEIADELAGISLPKGAAVIIGSQPGNHLTSFLQDAAQYQAPKWPGESIRALIDNLALRTKLQEYNLSREEESVVRVIVDKADGSPLYATYLARTAVDIAEGRHTETSDIAGLPLGYPYPKMWQSSAWKNIGVPHSFGGPVAAFGVKRDALSRIEFLAPHPVILVVSSLDLAPSERGLMFVDSAGSPAVVCINWQRKLIGEEHLADIEPTQYGMALFARPDVFEAVSALAKIRASFVAIVSNA